MAMENWALTNFAAEKAPIMTILRSASVRSGAYDFASEIFRVLFLIHPVFIKNMGVSHSETSCRGSGELLPIRRCNSS